VSDATIVYLVIAATVVLFVSNRLPVELVAILSALALYLTGVLTLEQALAGFGDPTVIFIASLFVVSEALEATGMTAWASQQLIARAGTNASRVLVSMMLLVALMTALITPNGAVAALVPVAVVLAIRLGKSPSELLLPLSYASFGGALLVLSGSPVNVIVSEASKDAGAGAFNYFEFAIVGIPLLIGTMLITLTFGRRLLPDRRPRSMAADFSEHARTLLSQYTLDTPVYRLEVLADSPAVGLTSEQFEMARYEGVELISAQQGGTLGPLSREALRAGDFVIAGGDAEGVQRLAADLGLGTPRSISPRDAATMYTREAGIAEVVIPPRSAAIGETVFPGMTGESGEIVVLAVQRAGEDRLGKTTLRAGDSLLLRGSWAALDERLDTPELLVVDAPDRIRRQIVPLGANAGIAGTVIVGMVLMLATGVVPPAAAALIAASALLILRVLTMSQAYRAIAWPVVILIAAMIPVSTAMTKSGAADDLAGALVDFVGDSSPYVLIIALFVLVAIMGQVLSNTATALIVIPVAISAAAELDVSVQPVLMAVTVAASASFMTPVATTPNLMVYEPGGYRFSDYARFGWPFMLLYFVVAIALVPLVWRF
jgi:di/tricarboxylate transporter